MKEDNFEYKVKIVPGKSHLDGIYFGNLLTEVLGQIRNGRCGVSSFEVEMMHEFEYSAKVTTGESGLGREDFGRLLVSILGDVRDRGYGMTSFTVETNGKTLLAEAGQPKPKAPAFEDTRHTWTDLL